MQRRAVARWREDLITGVCRGLREIFGLARRLRRSKFALNSLLDLPAGARVAIIKPCCLGDVVLATPVIRRVSEARPDLVLEFVVSDWARPVLENNPRLKALVSTGFSGSNFSFRQYLALVQKLRRLDYQAALVLDRSPRLAQLPWLAGIPLRAGLDSRGRGFSLNLRAPLEADDPLRPEAEIYLEVANVALKDRATPLREQARTEDIGQNFTASEFYPGEVAQQSFEEKARELGLDLTRPLAVIHPGGGQNPDTTVLSKRWPARNFAESARRLAETGAQVVLIGAKTDRPLLDEMVKYLTNNQSTHYSLSTIHQPPIIDAGERFSFAEIGALYERAGLFVGNDTGLMHLAVACGAPTVAIFGPSSPIAYGPYTRQGRAVSPLQQAIPAGLPLSEYQALTAEAGGIAAVTVEQVWEAIETFLPVEPRTANPR